MRIAAVQLRSGVDIDANLRAAEALIREAAADGAAFIATPEMTHLMQRSRRQLLASISPQETDTAVQFFAALAAELGVHLLIGSLAILVAAGRAVNRSFLFAPTGDILASYDKIHLFDAVISPQEKWQESRTYDRGKKAVSSPVGGGAILGLSICYDLRFAALYRHYAAAGAHIIAVPAAFTAPTGKAHWETLLRARAIETGSFIIAPAQGGRHEDGRTTYGHSLIIGPWGEVLAQAGHDEPGIVAAQIDLQQVKKARARIPAWNHNPDYSVS